MKHKFPSPGHGYKIRELVGGGNWKTAYRASSSFNLGDVALLYLNDEKNQNVFAKDVYNSLRSNAGHEFFTYLAEFKGLFQGDDGRMFLVEEFLARPLDSMAPINDLVQFVRIARDLSRGLLCLHDSELIHRDLKLDNCGVDHLKRAKIFDLGSVTSEEGEIRGSVLTRSPELTAKDALCNYASDVWALGATLYALRSNAYPFVHDNEVASRKRINEQLRMGQITLETAKAKKAELDALVEKRLGSDNAWPELRTRVHSILRGRSEEILLGMLEYDPEKRLTAKSCENAWNRLSHELSSISHEVVSNDKWDKIQHQLRAAERRELSITPKQLERLIAECQSDLTLQADTNKSAEVQGLIRRVKVLVS